MRRAAAYIIFLVAAILLQPFGSRAESVNRRVASRIAGKFFETAGKGTMAGHQYVNYGRQLTTDDLFIPFYVFNSDGCFVVVSADNKTFPILAYSLHHGFNPEDIGYALESRLKEYAMEVELICHDSREPLKAADAWREIDGHITEVLSQPLLCGFDTLPDERDEWYVRRHASEFSGFETESPFRTSGIAAEDEVGGDVEVRYIGGGSYEIISEVPISELRVFGASGAEYANLPQRGEKKTSVSFDHLQEGVYLMLIRGIDGNMKCKKIMHKR